MTVLINTWGRETSFVEFQIIYMDPVSSEKESITLYPLKVGLPSKQYNRERRKGVTLQCRILTNTSYAR